MAKLVSLPKQVWWSIASYIRGALRSIAPFSAPRSPFDDTSYCLCSRVPTASSNENLCPRCTLSALPSSAQSRSQGEESWCDIADDTTAMSEIEMQEVRAVVAL